MRFLLQPSPAEPAADDGGTEFREGSNFGSPNMLSVNLSHGGTLSDAP